MQTTMYINKGSFRITAGYVIFSVKRDILQRILCVDCDGFDGIEIQDQGIFCIRYFEDDIVDSHAD